MTNSILIFTGFHYDQHYDSLAAILGKLGFSDCGTLQDLGIPARPNCMNPHEVDVWCNCDPRQEMIAITTDYLEGDVFVLGTLDAADEGTLEEISVDPETPVE
jgi:hypothetical protein